MSFMKEPLINLKRRSLGSKKGVECSIGLKYRTFKFRLYSKIIKNRTIQNLNIFEQDGHHFFKTIQKTEQMVAITQKHSIAEPIEIR